MVCAAGVACCDGGLACPVSRQGSVATEKGRKTVAKVKCGLDRVEVGHTVTFSKTVGESDVYLFADITGDIHANHVNEEYMKGTPYGRRIAHGVLLVGYMSGAACKFVEAMQASPSVSCGYDRIRFVRAVCIGDTINVEYKITEKIPEKSQARAQVTVTNQRGEVVAVATHSSYYP